MDYSSLEKTLDQLFATPCVLHVSGGPLLRSEIPKHKNCGSGQGAGDCLTHFETSYIFKRACS